MAANLSNAILNNNDLETVESGAPAYLLMMDGFLEGNPESKSLLRSASSLNGAYAGVFVQDLERKQRLTTKALDYAFRAMCAHKANACNLRKVKFQEYQMLIGSMGNDDIPILYTLGTAWAGWIQAHSDDWNAVAELARIQFIMKHLEKLDETYESGTVHLYLGVLASLFPPAMGGKPEEGRQHFERAITLSEGRNLMIKVLYAKQYARLVFDRDLHDRLLKEVIAADAKAPRLTLINTLAQRQALELLDSADDYF